MKDFRLQLSSGTARRTTTLLGKRCGLGFGVPRGSSRPELAIRTTRVVIFIPRVFDQLVKPNLSS
jgi:hypothetical protein